MKPKYSYILGIIMKFFSFLKYTPFSESSQRNHLMTASEEWHRRRSIRFPAAKDRALRGALGKGPPRARLLPELNGSRWFSAGSAASSPPQPSSQAGVPESAPPGAAGVEKGCVWVRLGYSAGNEWGVFLPAE